MKLIHAVFTFCGSHFVFGVKEGFHCHFCTAAVFVKNWDHLHNSLTVGFTKHNKTAAAFTTLGLDGISTELTTVRQV